MGLLSKCLAFRHWNAAVTGSFDPLISFYFVPLQPSFFFFVFRFVGTLSCSENFFANLLPWDLIIFREFSACFVHKVFVIILHIVNQLN